MFSLCITYDISNYVCVSINIYMSLCSKKETIYIYVYIYIDIHIHVYIYIHQYLYHRKKSPQFGSTTNSMPRCKMEPRRSKCQKHLEILHPKSLCLRFETISLLEAPPHIRPSGKGKSSSKNTFGGYVSSQEGSQSWGVKEAKSIPNDSRNKPWEVGHGSWTWKG